MGEERGRIRSDSNVVSIADKMSEVRHRLGMDEDIEIDKNDDVKKEEQRNKG